MTPRTLMMSILGLTLMLGGATLAADEKGEKKERGDFNPEEYFAKKDTNQDGKLSLEEFKAGAEGERLKRAEERFKKMDTNGDGAVTKEEFKAGFGKGRSKKGE